MTRERPRKFAHRATLNSFLKLYNGRRHPDFHFKIMFELLIYP